MFILHLLNIKLRCPINSVKPRINNALGELGVSEVGNNKTNVNSNRIIQKIDATG